MFLDTFINDIRKLLLLYKEAYLKIELLFRICSVNKAKVLRNDRVEDKSSDCSVYHL